MLESRFKGPSPIIAILWLLLIDAALFIAGAYIIMLILNSAYKIPMLSFWQIAGVGIGLQLIVLALKPGKE